MKLKNELSDILFSTELDRLEIIECGAGASVDFALRIGDTAGVHDYTEVLTTTYTADPSGTVRVTGLNQVLCDFMQNGPAWIDIPQLLTAFVIPTKAADSLPAKEILEMFPVDLAHGTRTAFHGSPVAMGVLLRAGDNWMAKMEVQCSAPFEVFQAIDRLDNPYNLVQVVFHPAEEMEQRRLPDTDYNVTLSVYDVGGGEVIRQRFDIVQQPYGGRTLMYEDSFGLLQYMPFAMVTKKAKHERKSARIDGYLQNYQVDDVSSWEGFTPPLHDGEEGCAEDFLRSMKVYEDHNHPLTLTGGELVQPSAPDALLVMSAQWRSASVVPYIGGKNITIFDYTYDQSFN